MKENQETSVSRIEQKILDNLHAEVIQSPLIEEKDGQYQVTFWYRLSDADTPKDGVKPEFSVHCPDLYDKMLDDQGNLRKMDEVRTNTGIYYLTINNVPGNTFAAYHFNKISGDIVKRVDDHANPNAIQISKFDINESQVIQQKTACIKLNPDAKSPSWATIQPPSQMKGKVTHGIFKDEKKSSDYIPFLDRDVWVYKPEGFDKLPPNDRKIIFMLDGKDFCETLTPYIDIKEEPFSGTAIVFIDPGKPKPPGDLLFWLSYFVSLLDLSNLLLAVLNSLGASEPVLALQAPGLPERVREYYYRKQDFSNLLAEQLLPKYSQELGINNKDNVTLVAHSLAAFPMIDVATNHPDLVGGVVLASAALNQVGELLPKDPKPELKNIPIFMQIGKMEDDKPPESHSNPAKKAYRELKDESRMDSNIKFHADLFAQKYTVNPELLIHPFGHDSMHVLDGLERGMQFILMEHNQQYKERFTKTVATSKDSDNDLTGEKPLQI